MPKSSSNINEWKPNPGQQEEAFKYKLVDILFYGGAKGGGKTDFLLFDFLDDEYLQNPNYCGIIFRRTFPRLREIIERSFKWFTRFPEGIRPKYTGDDRCWTFPSGARLYFGHCQYEESKYDYQGHEYQYIGYDQLEEFTMTQFEFLNAQARTSDPKLKIRIRATGNPGNIGHAWVKQKFIDNRKPMTVYQNKHGITQIYIPAKVYDNPHLTLSDPMYVKRLEALPEQDRKALLEGDWNIFAGQFFKEWRTHIHVTNPEYVPASYKKYIAGDYGYSSPSCVGWFVVDPEGNTKLYRELYKEQLTFAELAEEIVTMSAGEDIQYAVFDPAIFGDKQHHSKTLSSKEGESGADIMQKVIGSKFPIMRGDNRRIIGWNAVRELMKVMNGESKFKVFSSCVNFIRTFPANVFDGINAEDLNSDGEDHSADMFRYFAMSRPARTEIKISDDIGIASPKAMIKRMKTKNLIRTR